jgi:Leucine-rich repeat (LRR) protein
MKLLLVFVMLASIECHLIPDRNHLLSDHLQLLQLLKTYSDAYYGCIQCVLQKNWSNNCSEYANDDNIRRLFPFPVELKKGKPLLQTYALTNQKNNIYYLNIFKQMYFPRVTFCLKHLEELYVRRTSFVLFYDQLPPIIQVLSSTLIKLEIEETTIRHLPNEIGKLTKLEKLKLSNTGLLSLPDSIGDLSSLKFLTLTDNKLTSLPETINKLRSIQEIILTNNPYLHSIEPVNGLPLLKSLRTDNCQIECLPRNLPQLQALYMTKNNLIHLTDIQTLGNETNGRKSFYFDWNFIQSIPSNIQYVRNLNSLNLNHNQLKTLPFSIFNMNTLDNLSIQNNSFSDDDLEQMVKIFKCTNSKLILTYV